MLSKISEIPERPVVIIFEQPYDDTTQKVVEKLLEKLDFDTYCPQCPQDRSEDYLISNFKKTAEVYSKYNKEVKNKLLESKIDVEGELSDLSLMMIIYFFQKIYSAEENCNNAEKIKLLPAALVRYKIIEMAKKNSILIKGIDINSDEHQKLASSSSAQEIRNAADYREKTFSANILKLYNEGKSIITSIDFEHADGLLTKLKNKNVKVIYFAPYSPKPYYVGNHPDENFKLISKQQTLKKHNYCLSSNEEIELFTQKVIRAVMFNKNGYNEIVGGNSNSNILNKVFKTNVEVFQRADYYVDAFLLFNPLKDKKDIQERYRIFKLLNNAEIQTQQISINEQNYLMIPEVNTKVIGDRIHQLLLK